MKKGSRFSEYWRKREEAQRLKNITDEAEYDRVVDRMYAETMIEIQREIDAFYGRYADKEGITLAEAKKRVSRLDIAEYSRLAEKYVPAKDRSREADEAMRIYNLTMKVNRLEMLKAKIGVHLTAHAESLARLYRDSLDEVTAEEIQRQAGIMGDTIKANDKQVHAIVNASFHSATFSARIWASNEHLKHRLERELQSAMIRGARPDYKRFSRIFGSTQYEAKRLLHTEMKRCRTEAAMQSYDRNGFEEFQFLALGPRPCPICRGLNGKHFKVREFLAGDNAPPIHPNCRCSTAPWMDEEAYQSWLDAKSNGSFSGGFDEWTRGKK